MSNSTKDVVKNVFSNRNILAISLTTTFWGIFNHAWQPYWALYLKYELGATVPIVGLLSMIQSAEQVLFQLPGGVIADKFGRKRIIVLGTSLRLIPPIVYLLATSWEHVLPAVIINATGSLYMPAFNAMIADSLPSRQRGTGYGAYQMITSLPGIFMPALGGFVLDTFGFKEGVRLFNVLTTFTVMITIIVRAKLITETLAKESKERSTRATLSAALDAPRSIWIMVFASTIGGFAMRLVMNFTVIYAKENIGLTVTQLGLAQTAGSILHTVLIMPTGMLSDRIGRRPMILFSHIVGPLTNWGLILVQDFPQYLLLRLIGTIGGTLGGPAWQAMIADIIPREKRGTVMGLMSTASGAIGFPSPMLGGYIWENYSPETAFNTSLIIGLMPMPILTLYVKEPRKEEE